MPAQQTGFAPAVTSDELIRAADIADQLPAAHAARLMTAIAGTGNPAAQARLVLSPACPPGVLDALARAHGRRPQGPDTLVVVAVASNPAISSETIEQHLVRHPEPAVRLAVARHPSATGRCLDVLAADREWAVRQEVAFHAGTSEGALARLVLDGDSTVANAALAHSRLPVDLLTSIAAASSDAPQIRAAGKSPNLPAALAARWSTHHDATVVAAVASNPNLPGEDLDRLGEHFDVRVRASAAGNPYLPERLASRFAADPEETVRLALAANPDLPASVAMTLLVDDSARVRRKLVTSRDDLRTSSLLQAGADEDDIRVLTAILAHPSAPPHMFDALYPRLTAAPAAVLRAAARAVAFRTGTLPARVMHRLAAVGDVRALAGLASRVDCPTPVFVAATKHVDSTVRSAAAGNPDCPDHILVELLADSDPVTRLVAASHPAASAAFADATGGPMGDAEAIP